MAQDAAWTITNTSVQPIAAMLAVELWAFPRPRVVELLLDGRHVQHIGVERSRRVYHVGPLTVPPGDHALAFRSADAPTSTRAVKKVYRRAVSVAVGTWTWTVMGEQP